MIKKILFFSIILITIFGLNGFVLASCPEKTKVDGIQATLVGEITNTGSDSNFQVWFQYGKTSNFEYETSPQSKTGTGLFCAFISNLEYNTTYYYRAVIKNNLGVFYGQNKTFKTAVPPSLSVSLSASPSSGCAPLNNVDLSTSVSGTASGDITYFFDCTNNGTWEKTYTSSQTSFTAYDICSYSSPGIYSARVRIEKDSYSAENTISINAYSCSNNPYPKIDIKANNSDSLTINYGNSINLSWSSSDTNYCYASNDWSGTKPIFGSELITNLTSSKTYSITCTGPGGTASDSVSVYVSSIQPVVQSQPVQTPQKNDLLIKYLVSNLSDGTKFANSISADPGEIVSFLIEVKNPNSFLVENITVKSILSDKISFYKNLRIDNVPINGDIISGINIGNLSTNQTKTITFEAQVAGDTQFGYGETQLKNTASAFSQPQNVSVGIAFVVVSKKAVLGATTVATGLTNNLFIDSFLLPFIISLIIVYIFKSRIIKWEEWLDKRKKEYKLYKAKKLLQLKIAKAKAELNKF